MNIIYPIFQKASFYLEKYGRETFLADAGQRSRAIIPGDDPGDQQPPERRPESMPRSTISPGAVMHEPLVVEQPA
jgi:hypothetical protein